MTKENFHVVSLSCSGKFEAKFKNKTLRFNELLLSFELSKECATIEGLDSLKELFKTNNIKIILK